MPYVSATLQAAASPELTARVIGTLTDLTAALPVREVNRVLQSLLGEASGYVAVEELAADSWGYTGVTQELHYLNSKLPNGTTP